MTQKININLVHLGVLVISAILFSIALLFIAPQPAEAQAGACNALPSTQGLATHTENDVASGTYTVFARVKVASGPATFDLSIDGAGGKLCDYQVSEDGSDGAWVWHKSSSTINWSGGDMRFQMSGDKSGVGLDCVVLADASFNPSTKEDCNPTDPDPDPDPTGCDLYDVDNSGVVNILDVAKVFNNLSSSDTTYDVDNNGSINILDVAKVFNNLSSCSE